MRRVASPVTRTPVMALLVMGPLLPDWFAGVEEPSHGGADGSDTTSPVHGMVEMSLRRNVGMAPTYSYRRKHSAPPKSFFSDTTTSMKSPDWRCAEINFTVRIGGTPSQAGDQAYPRLLL
jgi:hypothetical protein